MIFLKNIQNVNFQPEEKYYLKIGYKYSWKENSGILQGALYNVLKGLLYTRLTHLHILKITFQ